MDKAGQSWALGGYPGFPLGEPAGWLNGDPPVRARFRSNATLEGAGHELDPSCGGRPTRRWDRAEELAYPRFRKPACLGTHFPNGAEETQPSCGKGYAPAAIGRI